MFFEEVATNPCIVGAGPKEFTLQYPRILVYLAKDAEADAAATGPGSTIQLTQSTLNNGVAFVPELVGIFWSVQYTKPPQNAVQPMKPFFGLKRDLAIPKGKAVYLTKAR